MLNKGQEHILKESIKWWKSSEQLFQISGHAGTGKTFLLYRIIDALGVPFDKIAFMAYTGQAAIVMRNAGMTTAKTIHSTLYEPVEVPVMRPDGTYELDPYYNKPITKINFVPRDLTGISLFVIDEAGMVDETIGKEVMKRGIKTLVIGDLDQLPPITGDSYFLKNGYVHTLTEIMRQAEDNPIIYLAERALKGLPIETGIYGNSKVIYRDELTDYEIVHSDMIICATNKTRDMINMNYRHNILRCNSELPVVGEKMICRKNNWLLMSDGISLVNGLSGIVTRSPGVEGFDGRTYTIDFQPYMCGGIFIDLTCDYQYLISSNDKKKFLKNSKYSTGEKMEYAYAITTHLSQGSQYNNGIYIEEFLRRDIQRNLLYTGITRFKDRIIYVKERRKYF